MRPTHLLAALVGCFAQLVFGQTAPMERLALNDLSAFEPTSSNWQIVGAFHADLLEDHAIDVTQGTGILANIQTPESRGHLFTSWGHKDVELDLEVVVPKGSNSGIYFQSRYEIQLFDSWGVQPPRQSDMGGIYQRWDESREEGQKGYEGHPPRINVARAPGLWQHLNVLFKAPRFDSSGNKIENARFERVMLNGVVIHENVELTGPTRSAAFEDEVGEAPLMIQGDHGPVAFRNVKYRMYSPQSINLSDVTRTYYEGEFNHQMPDLASLTLKSENESAGISSKDAEAERQFVLQYKGMLSTPESGTYVFEVAHTSRVRLMIDGVEVLTDQSERVNGLREFTRNAGSIELQKGNHDFELVYAKGRWHGAPTVLGFYASGPGLMRSELSEAGSVPGDAFSDYEVSPDDQPWLQRNFVPHKGMKRTHAISVGYPGGVSYNYDMSRGALLHVWKGPFVDASSMWYQRGNMQSALPLGSVIERSGKPTVGFLENDGEVWADSLENFTFQRYELNANGEPTFIYSIGSVRVVDHFTLAESSNSLARTLAFEGLESDAWILLAESESVVEVQPGLYAIDDQRMYVDLPEEMNAQIRDASEGKQLILPVSSNSGAATVQYSLIW